MRHSTERILVSHGGNLPRPAWLDEFIDGGKNPQKDPGSYTKGLPDGVKWVVDRQIELGVDIVNDGEYVKAGSFGGYINSRVSGIESVPGDRPPKNPGFWGRDGKDFPGFVASGLGSAGSGGPIRPGFFPMPGSQPASATPAGPRPQRVVTGPIKYTGHEAIKADVANLKAALEGKGDVEGCLMALGVGTFCAGPYNEYYRDQKDFLFGAAEALREEYKIITDAGLIVQLDEPEIPRAWHFYPDWTIEQYRNYVELLVEAINHSLEGIPEELVRLHVCWGSGHRPHISDIEMKYINDIMVKTHAQCITFEAANVRHEHEYHAWEGIKLRPGQILGPSVIAHATDLVEHPELVAERIMNYANIVGRENVQTNTDCGIGSRVGHEEIAWAKLKTMAEGAKIASERLWR
jgi:5-methyltetrahydropteroyltriglutamate--homocysteine methyltransferase